MIGNLDNLALGMGLTAKPEQQIPAKYAALDGWSYLSATETAQHASTVKKSLGLLGTLVIIIVTYKLLLG